MSLNSSRYNLLLPMLDFSGGTIGQWNRSITILRLPTTLC